MPVAMDVTITVTSWLRVLLQWSDIPHRTPVPFNVFSAQALSSDYQRGAR